MEGVDMNPHQNTYHDEVDNNLIGLITNGNREALNTLLGRHKDWIYNIALRMTGKTHDAEDVENTVRGTEAVLSTIGPPQRHPGAPESYQKAMETLVAILEHQKIQRLIHVGGAVHPGGGHEQWSLGRRFLRLFLNLTMKPVLVAKHLEWEVLKHSNLDWTLVRPPRISNGHSIGHLVADEKSLARTQVNVDDLAHFMVAQIRSAQWVKKAPLVASVR